MSSAATLWQRDGWGWRARIGVITPHADINAECELAAMAKDPTMEEEIDRESLRAYVEQPQLDEAAELLAAAPLSVIAYAFSTTSYLGGSGEDGALKARLERRTSGIPVVTTCGAALLALRAFDVSKLALIHPPGPLPT